MSSRSTSKSVATVLEPIDDTTTELIEELQAQAPTTDPQTLVIETEVSAVDSDDRGSESSATDAQSEGGMAVADGPSEASGSDQTAELLAQQPDQPVPSVAAVED